MPETDGAALTIAKLSAIVSVLVFMVVVASLMVRFPVTARFPPIVTLLATSNPPAKTTELVINEDESVEFVTDTLPVEPVDKTIFLPDDGARVRANSVFSAIKSTIELAVIRFEKVFAPMIAWISNKVT